MDQSAQSLQQLWHFAIWATGLGATFLLAIIGWIFALQTRISVKEDVHKTLDRIQRDIHEISKALVGDYDKKGLLTKHHELEDRVRILEVGNK